MQLKIRTIDIEEWKCKHPISTKRYPNFCTDCKREGDTELTVPYSWNWIQRLVIERDNYQCRICSKKARFAHKYDKSRVGLEVHHIIPKNKGGSDHPANLITLCRTCHLTTFKRDRSGLPIIQKTKIIQFIA